MRNGYGMGLTQPCPAMQGWRGTGSSQYHDQTSNQSEDPISCRGDINKIAGSEKNRASIFFFGVLNTHNKSPK